MNLIIDVGNTLTKVAVFEGDELVEVVKVDQKDFLEEVKKNIAKYQIVSAIISTVAKIEEKELEELQKIVKLTRLDTVRELPFTNSYKTPHTLGLDRIGLVVAAQKMFSEQNVLVIDAGTCITFDFLSSKNEYLGGAISPGIRMRYQALHNYTAKLPLLETTSNFSLVGNSTQECMHSGVLNGVIQEIDGVIELYKQNYRDLTVVLTGGDIKFLSKQLKNSIFATQNFLLYGLNEILTFNNHE